MSAFYLQYYVLVKVIIMYNWKYQSKYNSDFYYIDVTEITWNMCNIGFFCINYTLIFRHYESQEPGTYTLYKNKDPVGNINEVNF